MFYFMLCILYSTLENVSSSMTSAEFTVKRWACLSVGLKLSKKEAAALVESSRRASQHHPSAIVHDHLKPSKDGKCPYGYVLCTTTLNPVGTDSAHMGCSHAGLTAQAMPV
jgi:hypothetical protein